MELTRRQFLVGPAGLAAIAALPKGVLLEMPRHPIVVDAIKRTIQLNEPMHMQVLYAFLCDRFDEMDMMDDPFPMHAITPDLYEFEGEWTFADDESRRNIRQCAWAENGRQWMGINPVGWGLKDQKILWQSGKHEGLIEAGEAIDLTDLSDVTFHVEPHAYTINTSHRTIGTGSLGTHAVPLYYQLQLDKPSREIVDCRELYQGWYKADRWQFNSEFPDGAYRPLTFVKIFNRDQTIAVVNS